MAPLQPWPMALPPAGVMLLATGVAGGKDMPQK